MATGGWTHVLTELSPLEALEGPLRRSARLRYTCVSVSKKYVALGSNTGGVYIFAKDSLKHLQVVFGDAESSPVAVTALSPNDNFVAYANGLGHVIVMEMNIERRQKPERVRLSSDHVGHTVTCLQWAATNGKLFVGDNVGKITVCYIPSSKAKTLFLQPTEVILRLDASVVQMDWWGDKLLVSTWSKSFLINTPKQQYSQIGKKLRDGEYGSCFFLEPSSQYPVIYCSRPGSRVWEVDFDANVLNTHQFKQLLAIPPLPVVKLQSPVVEFADPSASYRPQSLGFNKLCRLGPYLVTWSDKKVFVLDPVRVRIILWNEQETGIRDLVTNGIEIYVFLEDQSLRRFHLLPVEHCLQLLLAKQVWSVAGELLCYLDNFVAVPFIQRHIKMTSLSELAGKLFSEGHDSLAERVQGIIDEISCLSDSADGDSLNGDVAGSKTSFFESAVKLPSGIFLVNNSRKPSLDSDIYGLDTISQASFTSDDGASEPMQRATSMDNLAYGIPDTEQGGMRKAFSTTALDSFTDGTQDQGKDFEESLEQFDVNKATEENSTDAIFVDVSPDDQKPKERKEPAEQNGSKFLTPEKLPDNDKPLKKAILVSSDDSRTASVEKELSPVIAEPIVAQSKQRRKKRVVQVDFQTDGTSSLGMNKGSLRRSSSTGSLKKTVRRKELKSVPSISIPIEEEISDRNMYTRVDKEYDTISIDTLSSIDEDAFIRPGETTPETLSLGDGDNISLYSNQGRAKTPIFQTDEEIPSLLQRLSASGVSAEDISANSSKEGSPLSQGSLGHSLDSGGSGSPGLNTQSPKMALLAVKDSLSLKLSSKTKSLIKTIRKKSPLGKSTDDSLLDTAATRQEEEVRQEEALDTEEDSSIKTPSVQSSLFGCNPQVDLSELESKTMMTKRNLQDITVLMKPQSVRSILLEWMTVLHHTLRKLHLDVDKERKVKVTKAAKRRQLKQARLSENKSKVEAEYTQVGEEGLKSSTEVKEEIVKEFTDNKVHVNGSGELSDQRNEEDGGAGLDNDSGDNKDGIPTLSMNTKQNSQRKDECQNRIESLESSYEQEGQGSDEGEIDDDCYQPVKWTDVIHLQDPFRMTPKFHADVAELSALCFSSGCHGQISHYLDTKNGGREESYSNSSHTNTQDNQLSISGESGVDSNNASISCCGHSFMCTDYCDTCDHETALVVRSYFHFFSMTTLRKTVNSWSDNWFHIWQAIVETSQALGHDDLVHEKIQSKDFNGATDLLRSHILSNKDAFIGHVARLFGASASRAVEFGAECPKHIFLQDVLNFCRLHNNPAAGLVQKYVEKKHGEMPSYLRVQVIQQLCTRDYLTLALLECLLAGAENTAGGSTEPRPGDHMTERANQDLIDSVLDLGSKQDLDKTRSVCRSQRYWRGCLQLWRKTPALCWKDILQVIVCLGDITLLDDTHEYGYLPQTPEEWEFFLQTYKDWLAAEGQGKTSLTWEGIGELMMKTVGPQVAVALLQGCNIPEGDLNSDFYRKCILEATVQMKQSQVIHNMLEKVDTYLWSQKQPHLTPKMLYAVTAEKRGRSGTSNREEYQEVFSHLSVKELQEDRSVEDAENHWGVTVDITKGCENCSLPLSETVSHIVPGVLIFPCGHCFHKFCVPLKVCPLCSWEETSLDNEKHILQGNSH